MGWIQIGAGNNIGSLKQTVGDMNLPPGTKIRAVMDTKFPSYFDGPTAAWSFSGQIPPSCELLDVWGEGPIWPWASGQAVVEMEVKEGRSGLSERPTSQFVSAQPISGSITFAVVGTVIGFIAAHWLAILIAGIVITLLISFIRVMVKIVGVVEGAAPWLIWTLLIGGVAVAGYLGYKYISGRSRASPVSRVKNNG